MPDTPQTRFALNGDVHLAYQTFGHGSVDVLFVDAWVHHVEVVWEVPDFARFLRRLGSFARVIHFDRRGTGLSDPVPTQDLPDLPTQVDDALAVLDAAGMGPAAILGLNDGCQPAMLLAATHPERCRSLVLYGPAALQARTPDHQLGVTPEFIEDALAIMKKGVAEGGSGTAFLAPSRLGDERFEAQLTRLQRSSVRPGVIAHFYRQSMEADIRPYLKDVRAPTLVVHREGNRILPAELAREVAELIPGARYVGYGGEDALIWSAPADGILDEVEEFLTGQRTGAEPDRKLATVLFTDIVGSTDMAAEVGDRKWRDLIDHHDAIVRRELERFRGVEVNTIGDGFLATFDSPGMAVRCALAVVGAVPSVGVQVRVGVHTGEVEVRGSDIGGLAVNIGARVASLAGAGEVLTSSTVKDLLAGSDVVFDDRGEQQLKGVPGSWRLWAASRP